MPNRTPDPLFVRDASGRDHYRGSEEYTRILAERRGPSEIEVALARIEALTAINEDLTARAEAAARKAERGQTEAAPEEGRQDEPTEPEVRRAKG